MTYSCTEFQTGQRTDGHEYHFLLTVTAPIQAALNQWPLPLVFKLKISDYVIFMSQCEGSNHSFRILSAACIGAFTIYHFIPQTINVNCIQIFVSLVLFLKVLFFVYLYHMIFDNSQYLQLNLVLSYLGGQKINNSFDLCLTYIKIT